MQQDPLLTTKLYIPPARPGLVSRPRLTERLDEGLRLGCKLTLVTGWLSQIRNRKSEIENRVAWLSLDENDNDPVYFTTYLVAALQDIDPDIGQAAQASLRGAVLSATTTRKLKGVT